MTRKKILVLPRVNAERLPKEDGSKPPVNEKNRIVSVRILGPSSQDHLSVMPKKRNQTAPEGDTET